MKKSRLDFVIRLFIVMFAVCATGVYSQVGPQSDEFVPKKILVLGDSLSAAYKMPAEKGWVSLLGLRLEASHSEYLVVNASVSGATTAAGLNILAESLKVHTPAVVILELGANDGLQGKPIHYIQNNLNTLIEQSKHAGAEVVLLGVRLPPNFGTRYTDPFFDQFATLAKKHNVSLLPFLLEGVAGDPELVMADGLHPNIDAQPRILDNVWAVLRAVL